MVDTIEDPKKMGENLLVNPPKKREFGRKRTAQMVH
jgi:hypothetical protein